jgi:alpha-amylase/alpha-mannosidase (GH57 family)
MTTIHLVIFWHMHQPQYRDPISGRYVLPWTRLHALKDYWGMVRVLAEFPGVHATFNMVPALALQLEEYAGGKFNEPWFDLAFMPAADLELSDRREILERAFQVNHDNLLRRWPRFLELYTLVQAAGNDAAAMRLAQRDWRDLQFLSQLAWMDEEYLADDAVVTALSAKGHDFTEEDKAQLRLKQLELLARVLPEYRAASESGQVEISSTPFYHPILPLVCDTDIARTANPYTPLPNPAFRHPEDARTQLERARAYHQRLFGRPPRGLWPSEGSVSDATLQLAIETGFEWFATDEGVLGRTRNIGFLRDSRGVPENAADLYAPWKVSLGEGSITGLYRDHYLSDLVGFVYSRMPAADAAADLHRRIRQIGESWSGAHPPTLSLILDGENAWEYYPGNGRDFLRRFYGLIQGDADIRALTASEAIAAAGEIRSLPGTFPASWINANFDIWIGHADDVRAWNLLGEAREIFEREKQRSAMGDADAPSAGQLDRAYESVLAAEGSDWCWWYGPENSSANDADFDALYRKHLTGIYLALGLRAPDVLAQPIRHVREPAYISLPEATLDVRVDGRETSFFEWLGAGAYLVDRRGGTMQGRAFLLAGLHYGFNADSLFLRVDPIGSGFSDLRDCEFRLAVRAAQEVRITLHVTAGAVSAVSVEGADCPPGQEQQCVSAAIGKILEVRLASALFSLVGCRSLRLSLALWQDGLPADLLPAEGSLEIHLGEHAFAWPLR